MRRHKLLIATLAAFFALQAPLCALACLPAAPAEMPMALAEHSSMPCHSEAPASSPDAPAEHSDDCGCGEGMAALVPNANQSLAQPTAEKLRAFAPLHPFVFPLAVIARPAPVPLDETDLPPPDILLRKSTLLI